MNIRSAENRDFEQILELNQQMLQTGNDVWKIESQDLRRHLDQNHSLIIDQNEKLKGYLLTFPLEAKTTYPKFIVPHFKELIRDELLKQLSVCIGQTWINPEIRKQGWALKLFDHFSIRNKIYDLRIFDVDLTYPPSVKLYEKLGATLIKRFEDNPHSSIYAWQLKPE